MQHLVRTIVSALVDYPEAVEVQQVDGETTCILEVRVPGGHWKSHWAAGAQYCCATDPAACSGRQGTETRLA